MNNINYCSNTETRNLRLVDRLMPRVSVLRKWVCVRWSRHLAASGKPKRQLRISVSYQRVFSVSCVSCVFVQAVRTCSEIPMPERTYVWTYYICDNMIWTVRIGASYVSGCMRGLRMCYHRVSVWLRGTGRSRVRWCNPVQCLQLLPIGLSWSRNFATYSWRDKKRERKRGEKRKGKKGKIEVAEIPSMPNTLLAGPIESYILRGSIIRGTGWRTRQDTFLAVILFAGERAHGFIGCFPTGISAKWR